MTDRAERPPVVEAATRLCDEADKRGEVPWVAVEALRAALDAMAERQVGERLSAWAEDVQLSNRLGFPHYANPGELKRDVLSLARQLAEAERALEEARELLDQGIAWSPQGKHHFWVKKVLTWMEARQALHPPDPPASPAEGSEG